MLRQGLSTYCVQVVRLKDYNADTIIGGLEEKQKKKRLEREELMRMQAVLYTLAMKFLSEDELKEIKEEMKMTVLGEMIRQDGIEIGIAKGIREMILDNLEEGIGESRICEKLCRRFGVTPERAKEYFDKYCNGAAE